MFTLPLARSTVNEFPYTYSIALKRDATEYLRRIAREDWADKMIKAEFGR